MRRPAAVLPLLALIICAIRCADDESYGHYSILVETKEITFPFDSLQVRLTGPTNQPCSFGMSDRRYGYSFPDMENPSMAYVFFTLQDFDRLHNHTSILSMWHHSDTGLVCLALDTMLIDKDEYYSRSVAIGSGIIGPDDTLWYRVAGVIVRGPKTDTVYYRD